MCLNGTYTFSTECNLSYPKLELAKEYLESLNPKIEIVCNDLEILATIYFIVAIIGVGFYVFKKLKNKKNEFRN